MDPLGWARSALSAPQERVHLLWSVDLKHPINHCWSGPLWQNHWRIQLYLAENPQHLHHLTEVTFWPAEGISMSLLFIWGCLDEEETERERESPNRRWRVCRSTWQLKSAPQDCYWKWSTTTLDPPEAAAGVQELILDSWSKCYSITTCYDNMQQHFVVEGD